MRNKLLLLSIVSFILLCFPLVPLTKAASMWSRTYGGAGDDRANSLVTTVDGGYAIAGQTSSFGAGGRDFWLVKTDAFGSMEWNRTYGGASDDDAWSLVATSDGGYAIAGVTESFGAGQADFWFVKTDALGNMEWNKTYGGTGIDVTWSIAVTSDGGYVLAGYTTSFGTEGLWLVKTDALGNMQWNRVYSGGGYAYAVIATADGGYAITGYVLTTAQDVYLVKTDAEGNLEWNQTYGEWGWPSSLIETADGCYALAGGTAAIDPSYAYSWLFKTDSTGVMEWNETYGLDYDYACSLVATSDGGFVMAGYTHFAATGVDFWAMKTDASGNMQWNKTYGGNESDLAFSLVATSDGGYALAGYTYSFGAGLSDFWLVKTDENGVVPEYSSLLVPALVLTATAFIIISKKRLLPKRSEKS